MPKQGKFSIYAALYFYPILVLLHAVGGGLICMLHDIMSISIKFNTLYINYISFS
jgi:hypothetical protein